MRICSYILLIIFLCVVQAFSSNGITREELRAEYLQQLRFHPERRKYNPYSKVKFRDHGHDNVMTIVNYRGETYKFGGDSVKESIGDFPLPRNTTVNDEVLNLLAEKQQEESRLLKIRLLQAATTESSSTPSVKTPRPSYSQKPTNQPSSSPTVFPTFYPSISPTICTDFPDWADKDGDTCAIYKVNNEFCGYSNIYAVNGIGALQACCACEKSGVTGGYPDSRDYPSSVPSSRYVNKRWTCKDQGWTGVGPEDENSEKLKCDKEIFDRIGKNWFCALAQHQIGCCLCEPPTDENVWNNVTVSWASCEDYPDWNDAGSGDEGEDEERGEVLECRDYEEINILVPDVCERAGDKIMSKSGVPLRYGCCFCMETGGTRGVENGKWDFPSAKPTITPAPSPQTGITEKPSKSPTKEPTISPVLVFPDGLGCADLPEFKDAAGDTCEQYEKHQWCRNNDGMPCYIDDKNNQVCTFLPEKNYKVQEPYAGDCCANRITNLKARDACCVCGGGVDPRRPDWPSPFPSSTLSPQTNFTSDDSAAPKICFVSLTLLLGIISVLYIGF